MYKITRIQSAKVTVRMMHKLCIAILLGIFLSLFGCGRVPESSFELASESRLPRWFTLPEGLSRSDVAVTMTYFVTSSGRTSTFILWDAKKQRLAEMHGTLKGLEPFKLKKSQLGSSSDYPTYEVVTVSGVTEIVEHLQMEPIFYISDDPVVRAELHSTKPRDHNRKQPANNRNNRGQTTINSKPTNDKNN